MDTETDISLCNNGFNDWIHLSQRLKAHEQSVHHIKSMQTWLQTERNIKIGNTIDQEHERIIGIEKHRWKTILNV